jgi:hypothetical protein
LYQDDDGLFFIYHVIGFLDGKDADWNLAGVKRREKLARGGGAHMRTRLAAEASRLCEEGFTKCDPDADEGKNPIK